VHSSSKRIQEMIDNIMDLARGRLGGGITLSSETVKLDILLQEVAEELKVIWPERTISFDFKTDKEIQCDRGRIAQLASNLIGNAITHGAEDSPVTVTAKSNDSYWEISIANQGAKIPEHALALLFHPFHREQSHASQNGLGLGLYIASEIAKAHKGELSVKSDEKLTCFTLKVFVNTNGGGNDLKVYEDCR
jgi:sigma-B regulation protein RsbU (phosphoserine phosphatase)